MAKKLGDAVQLWHLIVGIGIAIGTPVIAAAVLYGTRESEFRHAQTDIATVKVDLDKHDTRERDDKKIFDEKIRRIDLNVERIATKLNVPIVEK
jgi:hypothetical protein